MNYARLLPILAILLPVASLIVSLAIMLPIRKSATALQEGDGPIPAGLAVRIAAFSIDLCFIILMNCAVFGLSALLEPVPAIGSRIWVDATTKRPTPDLPFDHIVGKASLLF